MKRRSQSNLSGLGAILAVFIGLAGLLMPSVARAGTNYVAMMHLGGSAEFTPNRLPRVIIRENDNSCDWFGYVLDPHGYRRVIHPCRFGDGEQDYTPSVRLLVSRTPDLVTVSSEPTVSSTVAEPAAGAEAVLSKPTAEVSGAEPAAETGAQVQTTNPEGTAAIALRITAGLEPGVCTDAETLEVEAGAIVYYCYTVTNTGDVPLALHNLVDSELGLLFTGMAYDLAPGASLDTVTAGLEASAIVVEDRTNNATWRAYVGDARSVDAVAQSAVTVTPVTE